MTDLPSSWALAPLRTLGTWSGGGTPSKQIAEFWSGEIPWVSPKDMKVTRIQDTEDHITPDAIEHSAAALVPRGSVLVVTRSGILRHSLPIAVADRDVTLNQDLKALTVPDGLVPEYVAWTLRHLDRVILSTCAKSGTTVQNLETARLLDFPIPVAPPEEQRRIVAAIEEYFSRLDDAEDSLKRAQQRLRNLKAALLTTALTGWSERPLGEFAEVFVGTTPSRSAPDLWKGDVPWVSSGEVAFCRILQTRETISPTAVTSADRLHPPGTVLLAMIGEGKTRGQAAILDVAATHNQNSAAIRLDAQLCTPEWLFYVLMARYGETRRAGSGAQQPALNRARVQALRIPLPPLEDQGRLVEDIERQLSLSDTLTAGIDRTRRRSAALRRSILEQAFSGKLVPQDVSEEPASVLLERIAADRAAAPKPSRGKRKTPA
jgi:type I restriction enzyme S subunit